MESRRATFQELRIPTWGSALTEDQITGLGSYPPRMPNQSALDAPSAVPVLSAMECYGCVDWYVYGSAQRLPGSSDVITKASHASPAT